MARVVAHLEAHVVRAEQPPQHLLARRQEAVDLGRRERRVQEKADGEPWGPAAQHRRNQHQVEVVDPDPRVRPRVLEDRVGEALVDTYVVLPGLGRDAEPVREVVEERPEGVVADPAVEILLLVRREEDRDEVPLLELLASLRLQRLGNHGAGPADPHRVPANRRERGRQTAGGRLHLEPVPREREPNRQAVARDDESMVSGVLGQSASFDSRRADR